MAFAGIITPRKGFKQPSWYTFLPFRFGALFAKPDGRTHLYSAAAPVGLSYLRTGGMLVCSEDIEVESGCNWWDVIEL